MPCSLPRVVLPQAAGLARLTGRDWAAAATYTVNFLRHPAWEIGHAWSLSIEEHFYLVWPFLMASAAARFGGAAAVGCMVSCFAARWIILLAFPGYSPMAELWTFTRMDSIAAGCLLGFLAWDAAWRRRLDRLCSAGWPVATVGLVLVGSLALSGMSAKYAVGMAYSVNAICIALLTWAALTGTATRAWKLLNNKALAAVGVASYSIYLWQQLFLNPRGDWACLPAEPISPSRRRPSDGRVR